MENQLRNSITPTVLLLTSLSYCHFVVTNFPRGIIRVICLFPIFYFFSLIPWYFSSSLLRGISAFFITWITSFKLLLFCFARGPLTICKTYIDFVAVSVFPLKIHDNEYHPNPTLNLVTSLKFIGSLLVLTIFINKDNYPMKLALFLFGLSIFLVFIVNIEAMTRYELVPLFRQPYLATSLQDFWGRRWNRMSSNILRLTVYDPTREALTETIGVERAKVVAIITTLVVSGVMHELMFYYVTCGMRPTWEVTGFFFMHGLCMVVEATFRSKGWSLFPPLISIPLTVGFAAITGYWLLVLPVWRSAQNSCM